MKMLRRLALASGLAATWLAACGTARIPEGTPPPEYEPPVVTPWPPQDAAVEPAASEAVPRAAEPGPEQDGGSPGAAAGAPGSADAGVVDAEPSLPSDAGAER